MIARVWSPDAPYDCVKVMFFPAVVAWNAEMRLANACVGVEYATMFSCAAGSDFSFAAFAVGADAPATPIAPMPNPATIVPTTTDRAMRPNFIVPPGLVHRARPPEC